MSLQDVDEKHTSGKYAGSGPGIRVADIITPTPNGALNSNSSKPPLAKVPNINIEMVNEFKRAYDSIIQQPVSVRESQARSFVTGGKSNRRKTPSTRAGSKAFKRRNQEFISRKQFAQSQLQKVKERKELEQCTFQPNLVSKQKKSGSEYRSVKQFIRDQQTF